MRKHLLKSVAVFCLMGATPAAAHQVDMVIATFSFIGACATAVGGLFLLCYLSDKATQKPEELPPEPPPTEPPEFHNQQAAHNRARARELEAEAMLAESQLLWSVMQDELKKLDDALRARKSALREK